MLTEKEPEITNWSMIFAKRTPTSRWKTQSGPGDLPHEHNIAEDDASWSSREEDALPPFWLNGRDEFHGDRTCGPCPGRPTARLLQHGSSAWLPLTTGRGARRRRPPADDTVTASSSAKRVANRRSSLKRRKGQRGRSWSPSDDGSPQRKPSGPSSCGAAAISATAPPAAEVASLW